MHKLAEICVRRPVFATMLIIALMVVGGFSFMSLGLDLFPKIDLPTVSIQVTNPGSSAEEVKPKSLSASRTRSTPSVESRILTRLQRREFRRLLFRFRWTRTATSRRRKFATK